MKKLFRDLHADSFSRKKVGSVDGQQNGRRGKRDKGRKKKAVRTCPQEQKV
jgi:hypothetical protein